MTFSPGLDVSYTRHVASTCEIEKARYRTAGHASSLEYVDIDSSLTSRASLSCPHDV